MTVVVSAGKPVHVITGGTNGVAVTARTGPQGPQGVPGPPGEDGIQGPPGEGVAIKGTLSGTATSYPPNPDTGDTWIIGTPVPTVALPAAPGDGIVWDGDSWNNVGPLRGPKGDKGDKGDTGPQGIQGVKGDTGNTGLQGLQGLPGPTGPEGDEGDVGPPGIYMSPSPPLTTDLLWADTDEEGTGGSGGGGTGGVNAVFAHNSPAAGLSSAPGYFWMIQFDDPFYGTPTALPGGWAYASGATYVVVPAGVYSYYLSWTAPDQYWYGQIETGYQLGKTNTYIYINPSPAMNIGGQWYGAAAGTVPIHNTGGLVDAPWFGFYMTHPSQASATNACKWQFNVTRLGDLPA
jgi:hypothetical protein